MKSFYSLFTIGTMLILFSCKSGENSVKQTPCSVSGKYINYTVLQHCPDIMPGDVPSFALELEFKGKDTVDVNNGFERFHLPFTGPTADCNYTILGATQFGDMHFVVQGDSTIQLIDSAWTKLTTASIFQRITENRPLSFVHYLNDCLLTGSWTLVKPGVKLDEKVVFVRNGQVDNFPPFVSFQICYAGDCMDETEPYSNTIDFMDDHGNMITYSYKVAPGKRSIQFFTISDPVPDMKGGRKIGSLAFELKQ